MDGRGVWWGGGGVRRLNEYHFSIFFTIYISLKIMRTWQKKKVKIFVGMSGKNCIWQLVTEMQLQFKHTNI